ncbi:MAG: LysM domain-containing protein [Comamonas sp.]
MKLTAVARVWSLGLPLLVCAAASHAADARHLPVTDQQRSTAQQVAQRGVPVEELAPNAPDSYTVKRGDTLWGISGLYLRRPWRWPELWGMNMESIRNPHLIYPGQVLYLEKSDGYARLRTARSVGGDGGTVKLTPRSREESLAALALTTLPPHLIEPFLSEPLVVDQHTVQQAPRLVATTDERVLMAQGDRAYARSTLADAPLRRDAGAPDKFRVFRNAVPLKDPVSGEILGYEAHYLGSATMVREEQPLASSEQGGVAAFTPATLEILRTKEEIRAGDRLLPEPARSFNSYSPHAPQAPVEARVVSLYASTAVRYGAPNQVAVINKGLLDGMENGHVLALVSQGQRIKDKTSATQDWVQLPDEENGAAMVFRIFDRVSYVLLMDVHRGVQVGDKLVTPQ